MPSRRQFLVGACGLALPSPVAAAPSWPARPVKVILPLQAGSASDAATRIVLEVMEVELGQSFTVQNVLGEAGRTGAARAAAAPADGYTLAALNNTIMTVLPLVGPPTGFDPVRDFIPLGGIATIPTFLAVSASVPVRTVPEFIAWARSRGGAATYASGGAGSPQHLAAELFMALADVELRRVTYRGATQAAAELAAGTVEAMFIAHTLMLPHLPGGRIRLIGFAGAERSRAFPDIPTLAEQGVAGYHYASWIGLFAPTGTPDAIVARLRATLKRALARPGTADRLARAGNEIWPVGPAELAAAIRAETARWQPVIQRADITLD
jgi:tripartite-type tricarboxylate transporter receptor subunit TctC